LFLKVVDIGLISQYLIPKRGCN